MKHLKLAPFGTDHDKKKRQKDAEQKNAPEWLTRPISGCSFTIISRSTIPVAPWAARDLERYLPK